MFDIRSGLMKVSLAAGGVESSNYVTGSSLGFHGIV